MEPDLFEKFVRQWRAVNNIQMAAQVTSANLGRLAVIVRGTIVVTKAGESEIVIEFNDRDGDRKVARVGDWLLTTGNEENQTYQVITDYQFQQTFRRPPEKKYLLICYRPNGSDVCRGVEMGRTDSCFRVLETTDRVEMLEFWAPLIADNGDPEKVPGTREWDVILAVDGQTVYVSDEYAEAKRMAAIMLENRKINRDPERMEYLRLKAKFEGTDQ